MARLTVWINYATFWLPICAAPCYGICLFVDRFWLELERAVCIDRYCGNVLHRSYGGGEQGKHYVAPSTTLGRPKVRYGHQIILVMFRNKSASLSTANPPNPPPRIYIFGCFRRINIAQHQSFSLPQLKPFGLCIPLSNPTNLSCLIF